MVYVRVLRCGSGGLTTGQDSGRLVGDFSGVVLKGLYRAWLRMRWARVEKVMRLETGMVSGSKARICWVWQESGCWRSDGGRWEAINAARSWLSCGSGSGVVLWQSVVGRGAVGWA